MVKQVSIKEPTGRIQGVNVFNGKESYVQFHPAEDDTGLIFRVNGESIPADIDRAVHYKIPRSLGIASCIAVNGEKEKAIKVEHLLSAIYALGIDNMIIELSDNVCPRQDNAATEVIEALQDLRKQGTAERVYLSVKKDLDESKRTVSDDKLEDRLLVKPDDCFIVDYTASFPHKAIGDQHHRFCFSEENYKDEIMKARGIFFLPLGSRYFIDSSFFKRFHGVTDRNALLIGSPDETSYLNDFTPEWGYGRDEFVRHKILDVIGTLALIGNYFKYTKFQFDKTGHKFDLYALKTLIQRDCFEVYEQARK
ncbi:UDP-3-O-acyl-N-acetylglucosamine deacetylase [Thermoproteota archaeon]